MASRTVSGHDARVGRIVGTNTRVLVVDDDADVRHLTRVALAFQGFEVAEAADGVAALAAVGERRPDVVVLDVLMPGMDGLQVLRALRADPRYADLPVVLVTGQAGPAAEQAGWAAGATAYVTKPFTGTALAATLRRVVADGGPAGRDAALARLGFARHLDAMARAAR